AGNVGIGFSAPTARLVIGAPSGQVLQASNLSDQDMFIALSAPGASDKFALFGPSTATNLGLGVGGIEKARINNMRNMGIGTKTPGQRLDVAGGSIRTDSQFISTVATGTPPFSVASTTVVPNLNASMLGGVAASGFAQLGTSNTFSGTVTAM